ncbi:MAG TPA: nuclear transport factor 2 family protein [Gemmatimonadaceae bacterium]|jgi:ketosteroid isomerase-like protein|nr:nuclear transport factor 2 family protein [Gemmatimonadaceae bacterium]
MTDGPIEARLMDYERQYWQAIKDRDVPAAMRLTDDPCIITGAQGVARITRTAFAGMLQAGGWTLHEFTLSDMQVRLLGDDVAVIAYKVKEKLTVDGKPLTVEAADSSTWVRREGEWMCSLHTEALLGDPFGRDKRPAPLQGF